MGTMESDSIEPCLNSSTRCLPELLHNLLNLFLSEFPGNNLTHNRMRDARWRHRDQPFGNVQISLFGYTACPSPRMGELETGLCSVRFHSNGQFPEIRNILIVIDRCAFFDIVSQ